MSERDHMRKIFGFHPPTNYGLTVAITPKCEHDWTGPEITIENGSTASCAKCGKLAIDHDMQS